MTRLCRFNDNRLGLVDGNEVLDVSGALDVLPSVRWPLPKSDLLIEHLDRILAVAQGLKRDAERLRNNDPLHRQSAGHAEGLRRLMLTVRNCLECGAIHLRFVCGIVQPKPDDSRKPSGHRNAEHRQAEVKKK